MRIEYVNYYYKLINNQDYHLVVYTNGTTRLVDDQELQYYKLMGVSI